MIGLLRFKLSGYGIDTDHLCPKHYIAWVDGRWFPRWCRRCRNRRLAPRPYGDYQRATNERP